MLTLVILLIVIVAAGKYFSAEQAATHERELAALRKELHESQGRQGSDDGPSTNQSE